MKVRLAMLVYHMGFVNSVTDALHCMALGGVRINGAVVGQDSREAEVVPGDELTVGMGARLTYILKDSHLAGLEFEAVEDLFAWSDALEAAIQDAVEYLRDGYPVKARWRLEKVLASEDVSVARGSS
jgi:ribosomal protein S4